MVDKLLMIRKKLENALQQQAQLQGEMNALLRRLKEEFGLDSVEGAENFARREEKVIAKLERELAERVEELGRMLDDR